MLHRAARNAYSWWWASHVRTKQSKWLEQNLQDMEEKVGYILKIIDEDGETFAQRAEMYYRKRPELLNFVEDSFRGYRALAERYDHLSKDLQSANRTIASVFPERVHFSMDNDDDFERETGTSSAMALAPDELINQLSKKPPPVPNMRMPKVPSFTKKNGRMPSRLMSRKGLLKFNADEAVLSVPASGLSKSEALQKIDKLQKEILALQTEKEFVKSSYEFGLERYWKFEKQITELQAEVSNLQDEFGIGTVIEDDEARVLMTTTALKSCQQTLSRLQEKQEQTAEEARAESQKIQEARDKFRSLREIFESKQANQEGGLQENKAHGSRKEKKSDPEMVSSDEQANHNVESLRKRIKEELLANLGTSLTMSELAEKVDELVDKIMDLEIAVSSQNAHVKRLRSETNELQMHLQSLEEEKEIPMEGSHGMRKKIKDIEEELHQVQSLDQSIREKNHNLQAHFVTATCNLDGLSEKLLNVKPDEEAVDNSSLSQAADFPGGHRVDGGTEPASNKDLHFLSNQSRFQANPEEFSGKGKEVVLEAPQANSSENSSSDQGHHQELEQQNLQAAKEQGVSKDEDGLGVAEDDELNWKELFLNGLDDKEKLLLQEYTSVLGDYKEVRKKLTEVEKKKRASLFQYCIQIKVLKSCNASKDEKIRSLEKKLSLVQGNQDGSCARDEDAIASSDDGGSSTKEEEKGLAIMSQENSAVSDSMDSAERSAAQKQPRISFIEDDGGIKVINIEKTQKLSIVEERIRTDIDELLEENIEFWMKFSTSFHQIQKFQSTIEDLKAELGKVKETYRQTGNTNRQSLISDIRPIYRHLSEIQTELTIWLDKNALLSEDMGNRLSSLSSIQEEITRLSQPGKEVEETELTEYQAAKFHGEILNMKQENNKLAGELQSGLEQVKFLLVEIERTLKDLDAECGISTAKPQTSNPTTTRHQKVPLRTFLFGIKLKKQKQSFFACMSPSLQRQYSDLAALPI